MLIDVGWYCCCCFLLCILLLCIFVVVVCCWLWFIVDVVWVHCNRWCLVSGLCFISRCHWCCFVDAVLCEVMVVVMYLYVG